MEYTSVLVNYISEIKRNNILKLKINLQSTE